MHVWCTSQAEINAKVSNNEVAHQFSAEYDDEWQWNNLISNASGEQINGYDMLLEITNK